MHSLHTRATPPPATFWSSAFFYGLTGVGVALRAAQGGPAAIPATLTVTAGCTPPAGASSGSRCSRRRSRRVPPPSPTCCELTSARLSGKTAMLSRFRGRAVFRGFFSVFCRTFRVHDDRTRRPHPTRARFMGALVWKVANRPKAFPARPTENSVTFLRRNGWQNGRAQRRAGRGRKKRHQAPASAITAEFLRLARPESVDSARSLPLKKWEFSVKNGRLNRGELTDRYRSRRTGPAACW